MTERGRGVVPDEHPALSHAGRPHRRCGHHLCRYYARKLAQQELQQATEYADKIVQTLREPLLVLTPDLRVRLANDAFYAAFQSTPEQTEGRLIYELGDNQWDIPALRTLLEQVLPQNNDLQ